MSEMFLVKLRLAMFAALSAAGALAPAVQAADKPLRTDLYGDPLPPGALMRLGTVRMRHVGLEIAFAADGKSLFSFSSRDKTIRHWDVGSGRELRRIPLQGAEQVKQWAWAGKSAAVANGEHLILWDTSTGRERRRIEVRRMGVKALTLAPDGDTLAAVIRAGKGWIVRLWDTASGKELCSLDRPLSVEDLAFSADGHLLGTVRGFQQDLLLWEVSSGKQLRTIPAAGRQIAFSPDNSKVAAVSMNNGEGVLKVWSVSDGREVAVLPKVEGQLYNSVRFSPDSKLLAVGGIHELLVFDLAGRKLLRRIPTGADRCAFAPDGKTLASASACAIHLWDTVTWREILPRPAHDYLVRFLAATPDGRRIVSLSTLDDFVYLWDVASGKSIAAVRAGNGRFHTINTGALSADGKRFAAGFSDGKARVWDLDPTREVRQLSVEMKESLAYQNPEIFALSFAPDADRLAAVSIAYPRLADVLPKYQLDVWDLEAGKSRAQRALPMERWPAVFTADGRSIVFGGKDRLIVQDVATGRERVRLPGRLRRPQAWSPDGQILAATVDEPKASRPGAPLPKKSRPEVHRTIVLSELASGQTLRRIETGPSGLRDLAFSPDGRTLAATTADGFHLWDLATGKEVFRRPLPSDLPGYPFATSLTFLPDGGRLATGLWDGTTLIWDLEPNTWPGRIAVQNIDDSGLTRLWTDLAGEDAEKAQQAVWTLAAAAAKSVPFLKEHLRSASPLDRKQVQRWIAELDNDEFAVRDAAARKLSSFGEQAEPALRQALEGKPTLEARKRLEALLADAEQANYGAVRAAELLRTLRAIRVLEQIGDRQAMQVLQKLAAGDPAARSARQAKEALQRLQRRVWRQDSR
ncbi:MAG TPA: WD40 repeat domain-containing protein [Gemmataceae bacterium]|nr:WD40 repeat domain-containing protein [Gemmataceae bacterium]